jgi:aryl-alcohol dehydrogenase-like predicted oxidoreductase
MLTRTLGRTGLEVSEVGLGTSKGLVEKLSPAEGQRLVARALDLGVTFVDCARHYGRGEAEARVGAAVRGRRDSVAICTKGGTIAGGGRSFARKSLLESMETSLRKLGTDHVDVYLLHMAGPGNLRPGCEAVETLLELKESGRARLVGASVDGSDVWPALENPDLDVLEITYNLADLYPAESGFLDAAAERGIGLVVKEPLAVANFHRSAPYPAWVAHLWERLRHYDFLRSESKEGAAEIALRFVLDEPRVHTAIPATSSLEHLEANVAVSGGERLPGELRARIHECYRKAVSLVG